jgi:tetratricopeptide (TPR) repeat protein
MVSNREPASILERARTLKAAGQLSEAATFLEGSLTTAPTTEHVDLLRELADVRAKQGAWNDADTRVGEALRLAEGDDIATALLLERRAWIYFRQGRLREAEQLARKILGNLDEDKYPAVAAALHNTIAGITWRLGNLANAIPDLARASDLFERAGDRCGTANAKTNLGVIYLTNGEWEKAARALKESETIRHEIGWVTGRSSNLLNLGWLEAVRGDRDDARKHLSESLKIATDAGEEYDIAHAELALAYLDFLEERVDDACKHIDSVLGRDACICDDDRVQAQWLKALIECDRGGAEKGVALASEARQLAQKSQLIESEADSCRALGIAQGRCENFEEAERSLTESAELAQRAGDPYRRALALLELALLYERAAARQPSGPQRWRKEVQTQLDEATRVFNGLGARIDFERAEKLRSRVGNA